MKTKKTKLGTWRARDSYYSEDYEDDTDEMNEIEDFFCVTLNNMSKEDAKFYGKTYGLFIRPNRKGYDLAGNEDNVREMLGDYIGRYDEIGKIMNEGWYVPDWNRDGFVDPNKRYADSKKKVEDSKQDVPDITYAEAKKYFGKDFINIEILGKNTIGVVYYDSRLDSDDVQETQYDIDSEGHILDINGNRLIRDSKKVKDTYSDKYKNIRSIKEAIQAGTNADVIKNIKGIIKSRGGKIIGSRVTPERIQIEWELNGANCLNTINLRESLFDIDCNRLAEDINRYSKKTIKDSVEDEVPEGHKEALAEYTQWEGIIGYDEDIIECYESGTAWVDDEYIDYEDSYDALDAYLNWEGIIGYTDAIYDILKNGVESVYYDGMLADQESYED